MKPERAFSTIFNPDPVLRQHDISNTKLGALITVSVDDEQKTLHKIEDQRLECTTRLIFSLEPVRSIHTQCSMYTYDTKKPLSKTGPVRPARA